VSANQQRGGLSALTDAFGTLRFVWDGLAWLWNEARDAVAYSWELIRRKRK
jgi:hypothetical protein